MNRTIRKNPMNAISPYVAENHSTLCGEMMDVQVRLGELMAVCAKVLDGKDCGALEAVEIASERMLVECEDLINKMRAAQPQTHLFSVRESSTMNST